MRVAQLAGRPEQAVREALLALGWEGDRAASASAGVEALAYHFSQVADPTLQALVGAGNRLGLDVFTGPDWALVSGARSRLSALARPWTSAEPLVELAAALGHALPADEPPLWQTARGPVVLDRPILVGILNLTPDSFSDGGLYAGLEAALARVDRLLAEGADLLDIGGESTAPGAAPISADQEIARIHPVLEEAVRRHPAALFSVDTTKAAVARAALDLGAAIVNDVSGFRLDPAMASLCAERNAGVILMHSRGAAGTLASLEHAQFPDGVVAGVTAELGAAVGRAMTAGVRSERIVVDPGLGFGKTPEQNLELVRGLGGLRVLGRPILIGPSRKRFLGAVTGRPVGERDAATATTCALGWEAGARLFRVHEPAPVRDALALARALHPR